MMGTVNLHRIEVRAGKVPVATFLLIPDRPGTVNTTLEIVGTELSSPNDKYLNQITMPAWADLTERLRGWVDKSSFVSNGGSSLVDPDPDGSEFFVEFHGIQVSSSEAQALFRLQPGAVPVLVTWTPIPPEGRHAGALITSAWQELTKYLKEWLQDAQEKKGDPQTHFLWSGRVNVALDPNSWSLTN